MEDFLQNHQLMWYAIACLSLVVELSVMGLSGPLLFFAIASVVTGILVSLGLVAGWPSEILVVGILTAIIAVILWKPLKKLQNSRSKTDDSSDMIGLKVPVVDEITQVSGSVRYSGVNWQARLADDVDVDTIASDTQCIIAAVSGTTMLVKPFN